MKLQHLIYPIVAVALCAFPSRAQSPVQISVTPPESSIQTIDAQHPPAVPLEPGCSATTDINFRLERSYASTCPFKDETPGVSRVTLQITGVRLVTRLITIIYLPSGASAKLQAHEQGHKYIGEQCYKDAYRIAYYAASQVVGKQYAGAGTTFEAAKTDAANKVTKEIEDFYVSRTLHLSMALNGEYDRLTNHGKNQVPETQAIQQVFAALKR